jgi:signal transduction histidine kinase/FixJ family two-component response regulator/HPt (histidine-containing phosphotransfer) domain-containing protein
MPAKKITSSTELFVLITLGVILALNVVQALLFVLNIRSLAYNQIQSNTTENTLALTDSISRQFMAWNRLAEDTAVGIVPLISGDKIDAEAVKKYLIAMAKNKDDVSLLYVASTAPRAAAGGYFIANNASADELPDDPGMDHTTWEYFIWAMKNPGTPAYYGPYFDLITGELMISLGYAVQDPDGNDKKILGCVMIDVLLEQLVAIINKDTAIKNRQTFLITKAGEFVSDRDAAHWQGRDITYVKMKDFFEAKNLEAYRKAVLENGVFSHLGNDVFIYSAYIPAVDWILVSTIPAETIFADANLRIFQNSIIRALMIIVTIGLSVVMMRIIKRDRVKLVHMKEAAEMASRGKSDFLARMSHEIRTPLNAILGLSEVELQRELLHSTRHNLEKIYSSGSLLLEIVNGILDISKIESGSFEIFPVSYEVAGLINDTIQLNIMRIGSKPIAFKLHIDETLPSKLYGDEVRIKQILNNLLSNSFKYTEAGEVRFSVTWEQEGDAARLDFTVEDTGRGIRQEDMVKLFSEYTQFEAAANRKIEGTGLGLSITKGLMEKMMGKMNVESEYGKGSIFRVSLPQGIVDRNPLGKKRAKALENFQFIEGRTRGRGNNLIRSWMPYGKVLVVDDLETNLDVMKGLLMPYGLGVDTATTGKEAIERIRSGEVRYDLVFMDHMMPEMDGIEAVRTIRDEIGTEYARTVPVIALTANAIAGNREMFLACGFNDYISKPIDINRLDMVLNQWIRDKQSEETLQEAENQNLARAEAMCNWGQIDAEGEWLWQHPVEGIDFMAAMILYGNSGAAYMPILKSFVSHTPLLLEQMDIHLAASSPDYAVEVHGLKGTCNAIGAGGIAEAARELEFASKEGNFDLVRRKHGTLREQALELTERLKTLLEEWEVSRPGEQKERREKPDRELLRKLSEAAAAFNSNETEAILEKLEQYCYEREEDLIQWLREQAENFDYEAMRKRLEEFLGAM